jgi:hypothetical protein
LKDFSVFEYQYRDASNYKAQGCLLLEGEVDSDSIIELKKCFDSGEFFIPDFVGIPPLQWHLWKYGGPNEDDHEYHEYLDLRKATSEEEIELELWGRVDDLLSRMRSASEKWLV